MELVAVLERQRFRATALDVSLGTGWTVEESEEALSRLMCDVRGTFEISGEDGRVLYSFPADTRARLGRQRWSARLVGPVVRHGETVLRFVVGGFVLASLAVVAVVAVAAAVAVVAAAAHQGGGRGRSRGPGLRGGLQNLHEVVRTWNLFTGIYWCCGGTNPFFRPVPLGYYGFGYPGFYGGYGGYGYGYGLGAMRYARRRGPAIARARATRAVVRDGVVVAVPADEAPVAEDLPVARAVSSDGGDDDVEGGDDEDGALLGDAAASSGDDDDVLSCLFAFFFGPPLARDEAKAQWRVVAAVVAGRGGCVAPEHLAPFLPLPPPSLGRADCERAACAAVAHFGGRPRACAAGGVILEFPDLATDADAFADVAVPEALAEPRRAFAGRRAPLCAALCVADVAALAWLKAAAASLPVPFPQRAADAMFAYAVLVLLVPATRGLALAFRNAKVDARNATRARLAAQLAESDDAALRAKASDAARLAAANRRAATPTAR